MITKIDIKKFGLFSNYKWDINIGNASEDVFKRVNIIYGRNYSGKTTLSRILRCIEEKSLHEKYRDGEFTITNEDGSTSSNTNLVSPYNIRVYNTDFVRDNLKFLYDENGGIEPFTLLGSGNNILQTRIDEITNKLGSIESGIGLLFDQDRDKKAFDVAKGELQTKERILLERLTSKANREIKNSPYFVRQGTTYNVNNIQNEIDAIVESSDNFALTDAEKDTHKAIINEQAKQDINEIPETKPKFSEREISTREIIGKRISVTNTIQELVNDAMLQLWVEQGRDLHRDKRDKCAFCGSDIRESRWQEIDAHFSKESTELKTKIADEIKLLEDSKSKLQTFLESKNIRKDSFYTTFHTEYDAINAQWYSTTKSYIDNIDLLLTILHKRDGEIFNVLTLADIEDNSEDVLNVIKQYNELIRKHNSKTSQLETDKNNSREKLRFSEISAFISDIEYSVKKKEVKDCKNKIADDEKSLKTLADSINTLELEKKEKEHAQKDEGSAATKVNELLSRFFGHNGLKLEPEIIDDEVSPKTKFIIKRGAERAHNLSEGECSLIAFCYFIAKMDDELKGANSGKLVIYIDDPISSLDNNHIFFMFSLIESVICKEKKYGQLFISTHNLEFFKYSKKLTLPKKQVMYLVVQRMQNCSDIVSVVEKMPEQLKKNITEYSFLFNELYNVIKPLNQTTDVRLANNYTQFYNLANNMRKFLECYLSYRLPNETDPLKSLDILFDNNVPALVNRVINEGSHLSWGDRGTLPQDVVEAESVAKEILKAIKNRDQSHFDSLCESVGVDKNITL